MDLIPANPNTRKYYGVPAWKEYLEKSKGKISEYNEDYYKYLRSMSQIRDLECYENFYVKAYDEVILGVANATGVRK